MNTLWGEPAKTAAFGNDRGTTLEEKEGGTDAATALAQRCEEVMMNGHDSNRWSRKLPANMPVVATAPSETAPLETPPELDLVIDFKGAQILDLAGLTMLLTAQQIADSENRQVWLLDLPQGAWRLLKALGLDDLFVCVPLLGEHPN